MQAWLQKSNDEAHRKSQLGQQRTSLQVFGPIQKSFELSALPAPLNSQDYSTGELDALRPRRSALLALPALLKFSKKKSEADLTGVCVRLRVACRDDLSGEARLLALE